MSPLETYSMRLARDRYDIWHELINNGNDNTTAGRCLVCSATAWGNKSDIPKRNELDTIHSDEPRGTYAVPM